jgi:formylglycine-generating enzyme required for sulfatase activity
MAIEHVASRRRELDNMVRIPRGTFMMGSERHYPEEAPVHEVTVDAFWIDTHTVTNAEFRRFVEATGYVTWAERPADPKMYPGAKPEMLAPSSVVFRKTDGPVDLRNPYQWWTYVRGADWRHPRGPDSTIEGLDDHPVVHVAFDDADAYARWVGKELPSEAEWEYAARGGLDGAEFCWGDELSPDGVVMANTWLGMFPYDRRPVNGHEWTAPVGSFAPNGYGLYDMAGNVWEWTTDFYQEHGKIKNACCGQVNPRGAAPEDSYDPRLPSTAIARRVMKGGSYLCATNYCRRYRPAARMAQPIDTSTCHLGFRCIVRDR